MKTAKTSSGRLISRLPELFCHKKASIAVQPSMLPRQSTNSQTTGRLDVIWYVLEKPSDTAVCSAFIFLQLDRIHKQDLTRIVWHKDSRIQRLLVFERRFHFSFALVEYYFTIRCFKLRLMIEIRLLAGPQSDSPLAFGSDTKSRAEGYFLYSKRTGGTTNGPPLESLGPD